jgi:hypothetical protein
MLRCHHICLVPPARWPIASRRRGRLKLCLPRVDADKVETENKRVEDMKEQIGDETFDLINMQLTGMGRAGMEKGTAHTRDGGLAADVAKIKPFAIDKA